MQEEKTYSTGDRELPTWEPMDAVRKLILDRTVDLQTNLSELSKRIGKNHAYLQQFIKRGVPAALPEDVRGRLAHELAVPERQLKVVKGPETTVPAKPPAKNHQVAAGKEFPSHMLMGERDLPIFGAAQGGPGVLIVSNDPVEWVARPAPLARVRDGYGVIVLEDSMSPEFEPGDIALVHPHIPPTIGATCIFKSHQADGSMLACIKRLRKVTADTWHVRQWNPPEGEKADYVLKRSEWQECHVTVGRYTRR